MLPEELRRLLQLALEPWPVLFALKEDGHPLLFAWLMEAFVERVRVGVDGQHHEREQVPALGPAEELCRCNAGAKRPLQETIARLVVEIRRELEVTSTSEDEMTTSYAKASGGRELADIAAI